MLNAENISRPGFSHSNNAWRYLWGAAFLHFTLSFPFALWPQPWESSEGLLRKINLGWKGCRQGLSDWPVQRQSLLDKQNQRVQLFRLTEQWMWDVIILYKHIFHSPSNIHSLSHSGAYKGQPSLRVVQMHSKVQLLTPNWAVFVNSQLMGEHPYNRTKKLTWQEEKYQRKPTFRTDWCSLYSELTTATFLLCPSVSGPITWLASPWVDSCSDCRNY